MCSDSRVQSLLPVGGRCPPLLLIRAQGGGGDAVGSGSACQLANLLACRFVGKLAGQGVGGWGWSAVQAQEQAKGFGGSGFTWSMLCAERKNQGLVPAYHCWLVGLPTSQLSGNLGSREDKGVYSPVEARRVEVRRQLRRRRGRGGRFGGAGASAGR